ncbi:phage tail-collar fiber domain-containing protein [Vibrio cholerae]
MTNLVPESEQQYGSILTVLGENAEQNGKLLNKQIEFTHIAFGDANDTYVQPDRKAQGLVNELHRIPVNSVDVLQATPDSVPILKVEALLPDDVNDVVIREFAAVATFNGQSYFHAIGNCARVYVPRPINNGNVSNPVTLEMTFVITSAEPIVEIDPNVVTASREWTQQNTVISVDTFSQAYNGSVKAKRLRTNCHTNFGRGGSEYIYIDTDARKKSQGNEYEFWNAAGHHYRLNHNRTISIEQFGAVDDTDIMPVLAKVLPLFKSGVLRIKSEGGDYRLAPGSITIDDFSASELDLRKANLRIDESLDKSTRITFNNPTSLEIKMNEVDYEGNFSHRLFDINNPKRLRVSVYDEIKNACYPSPDYVVDNLSAFMIVSGGSDIRIKFTEFFNMYHKNYDGTLVDRAGSGGEHLGRCISVHKLQGVASKRLRLSGGAVTECRTPFVFDGCDNLTAKSIDFTQLSDNAIYDLSCNNTVYDDMTFVECQDEGIVFSGVNKKFRALRFYNVSNKCAAINGYIKAVSFDTCSFRANSGDMPLNAIKTRTEVAVQSTDLTVSNCYFEGRVDYAVNYLQKIDKVSFNNKCRFVIEDNTNGRAIATFGDVGLLEVGNSDFVITGTADHNRIVSVVGETKLRTYDNEGLLENYLSYPEGGKLPVEFRDKNNIDPSTFTNVEEHKGNAHFVAPVTGGLKGRGYTMSFAFDSNVNSYDEIQTGGFMRVVKSDSNNVESDCRFEFWSAKSDKTGYELIGVIDKKNPLLPAEEPVA